MEIVGEIQDTGGSSCHLTHHHSWCNLSVSSCVCACCSPASCITAHFLKWRFQARTMEEHSWQMLWVSAALCFAAFPVPWGVSVLCGTGDRCLSRCVQLALLLPLGYCSSRQKGMLPCGDARPVHSALLSCPAARMGSFVFTSSDFVFIVQSHELESGEALRLAQRCF